MIRGLTQPVQFGGVAREKSSQRDRMLAPGDPGSPEITVIGVVCSGDITVYRDNVKDAIARGIAQRPNAVWVCCEPKSDRVTHDVMLSLGIEPVILPMIACMKGSENRWGRPFDERRTWRDGELLSLCDELIVFHKRTGHSPWRERKKWGEANGIFKHLFVVELGPEKAKK